MSRTGPAAFLRRRTGLVVPLLLLVIGVTLAIGTITMDVPSNVASPGPRLFPGVISVACVVLAAFLGADMLRRPEPERVAERPAEAPATADETGADETGAKAAADETMFRSNRPAVLGLVGTFVVFIALLEPLGWLLAGALLFWGVARALGSRRPVFDTFLSIAISSIVQLAFSAGLGLNLPPGVLAGVF
ncbi:tripartite tricarboxylate transporter TctB family protein [Streptomyces radicis]|uniref:Tripartite tricarboxylate transporter TctB family protein n=1 Tax=Streptomyces radicis TaxID=1750517 RepID=A0A3A9VYB2_9ACTN|nr:tripartite tricarboxylate transporter TctB family protein [Streptomyces radicis]RKN17777.1 tripartite tricarboxylate transporter TctB family protein [Streptomyces radicis]